MTSPLSVLVADDHAVVREGTRQLLERHPDMAVVGEAATGEAALEAAVRLRPDVVLLDLRLPDMSGIDVLRRLAEAAPEVRVVVLSAFADTGYVHAAMDAGASGYLLKTASGDEVAQTIRSVMAGVTVFDAGVSHLLAERPAPAPEGLLSPREEELVALVSEGMSNKAIAARLGISRRTVEGHIGRIFTKVGVATRTELARYAIAHGLAPDPRLPPS